MSDILVIGGGIIGLATARELANSGAQVTLVEMNETGRESSWAGGGILSPLYPWRFDDAVTALASWSQRAYPALCTELRDTTEVDSQQVESGLLILDQTEEEEDALAWAQRFGAEIRITGGDQLHALEPELAIRAERALWMPRIGQVRNPRLTQALRRSIEDRVQIREHEQVLDLVTENGRITGVRTKREQIAASTVIVCTGAWTAELLERLGTKPDIRPIRGQMMLFYAEPGVIQHISLYRDRYVIPRLDGRVLIGSTLEDAGFAKVTTVEAKEELYRTAVEMFPVLKHTPIEQHWAGLRPSSPSGIPFIGPYPEVDGLFINAGHFRNGVVTGAASARLMADLVLGRDPILDPAPYALNAER